MAEAVHDRWLPSGTCVGEGIVIGQVVSSGEDWQIAKAMCGGHTLLVADRLSERWLRSGLLDAGHLLPYSFGDRHFHVIDGGRHHLLAFLDRCESPDTVSAAMAFSSAMRATREAGETATLGGGFYVERLSRILPAHGAGRDLSDAVVLGTWLTGGIALDATSGQLGKLLTWIGPDQLRQVVSAAGLEPADLAVPDALEACPGGTVASTPAAGRFALPGRLDLETFFNDHVVDIVQNSERYRALGFSHSPSIVLAGPPGCGKTVAVERLIEFLGWPSYSVEADSIASPYVHETGRKISALFQRAIDTAPSVLVLDEMDAFLSERDSGASSSFRVEEVAEFLRRIPEASKAGVLIIGMTNRLDAIDPAILRRGRFDHVVKVDFATAPEVTALLEALTSGLPLAADVDLSRLGSKLAGRPLSDAAFVVREGARLAARQRSAEIGSPSLEAALAAVLVQDEKDERQPVGFIRMKDQ